MQRGSIIDSPHNFIIVIEMPSSPLGFLRLRNVSYSNLAGAISRLFMIALHFGVKVEGELLVSTVQHCIMK